MSHDYHESLPGFSPAQVLHDGCGECEARGANVSRAINALDSGNFARAWERATAWNRGGGPSDISMTERPLLNTLWSLQLQLEKRGVPIGEMPDAGGVASLTLGGPESERTVALVMAALRGGKDEGGAA